MIRKFLLVASTAIALSGCTGDLPVVGKDKLGLTIFQRVNSKDYVKDVGNNINDIQESTVISLEKIEQRQRKWMLAQLKMGVGLAGTIGFGPFKIGGSAGIELIFNRNPNYNN